MPSGTLAAIKPAANTQVQMYTPPAGKRAVGTFIAQNRTFSPCTISYAVSSSNVEPADAEYIMKDMPLDQTPLRETGLVVGSGQYLYVRSSTGLVSFQYNGVTGAET